MSVLAQMLAELRAEFPDWRITCTQPLGHDRWWATRGPLVREHLDERGTLDSTSAAGLREEILRHTPGTAEESAR
ncbi:hypothetical protein [Actinomadura litoris]|uniref:hypothetical protein n=1 Tax=Actinomadura litoris TaxID=2678616 RepID=UPI001FA7F48C|nr:hypothetical protein [Actinomadura litoris]